MIRIFLADYSSHISLMRWRLFRAGAGVGSDDQQIIDGGEAGGGGDDFDIEGVQNPFGRSTDGAVHDADVRCGFSTYSGQDSVFQKFG